MFMQEVLSRPQEYKLDVDRLGECTVDSPVQDSTFVEDDRRMALTCDMAVIARLQAEGQGIPSFEAAGARRKIFHDPKWSRAAIVTAGGLCPGLNDVIKGLVQILWFDYGIQHIFGIRYGLEGFIPSCGHEPIILTPDDVDEIHSHGGTILGSSRGAQDTATIVGTLSRLNINLLFCIGGDGTLRACRDIAEEAQRRRLNISVVGVPKTIDNDLNFIGRSFGFETSVYATNAVITSAHIEAKGAHRGIGLVKLMGRDSGFIAAYASLANSVVNLCLIPEVPFTMEGEHGLLAAVERRLGNGKTHAVIVVAEGAGQELLAGGEERRDASGNLLKKDIGEFLRHEIDAHFTKIGNPVTVKYFDPSYSIRSVPAQGTDAIHCYMLARYAVHAAMAGRTNCVIGAMHSHFSHVPIALATKERQKIDPASDLWRSVLDATRQNSYFKM
ncbi:MAG: ATP-dependent 6-phosphofructokinase [Kiritimatiellaeota bacterium]|nr:ATP-dependent 6-phosphofructokinase [Kiritimatiellota bacterium]